MAPPPAPSIVNVGVRNAASLAARGRETHFVVGAGADSDTAADLREFYGVGNPGALHVHRVPRRRLLGLVGAKSSVPIFLHAVRLARALARDGEGPVAVLTREAAFLALPVGLRRFTANVRVFYEPHDLYADLSWRAGDGRPVRWAERRQGFLGWRFSRTRRATHTLPPPREGGPRS